MDMVYAMTGTKRQIARTPNLVQECTQKPSQRKNFQVIWVKRVQAVLVKAGEWR